MRYLLVCSLMLGLSVASLQADGRPQPTTGDQSSPPASHAQLPPSTATPNLRCSTCDPGEPGNNPPPPPPPAGSGKVTFFDVNPAQKTITLQTVEGKTFVVDDQLGEMHLSGPSASTTLPLNAVLLQWSGGDAAAAAVMRAQIHDMVAWQENTGTLIADSGNSLVMQSGQSAITRKQHATKLSTFSPSLMMGSSGGFSFSCDFFYDCWYDRVHDFGNWGSYDFGFWTRPGSGVTGTPDWHYWNTRRQDSCNRRTSDGWSVVGVGAGMVGVCANAEWGVTAVACGGLVVGYMNALNTYRRDDAMCNASYPGENNWQ